VGFSSTEDGDGGGGGGAEVLNDLTDVSITAAATGDILRHNGSAWVDVLETTLSVATAAAWTTARTITLSGDVSGTSPSWSGSGNLAFTGTVVADNSHDHLEANISDLVAYLPLTGGTVSGILTMGNEIRAHSGSVTDPGYAFSANEDTGIYYNITGQEIGFTVDDSQVATIGYEAGEGKAAVRFVNLDDIGNVYTMRYRRAADSSPRIQYEIGWYSSLEVYKKNIVGLEAEFDFNLIDDIHPIAFDRRKFDSHEWGFSADELNATSIYLTVAGNEAGEAPDEFALLGVAYLAIQDLRKRVTALETV